MNDQLLLGIAAGPAIVGLVDVLKDCGLPSRYAPLAAVALGILAGLAQQYAPTLSWIQPVVLGIVLGLGAVGLYALRRPEPSSKASP